MTFINDFATLGVWPMNEPSGSPFFHNYGSGTPNGTSHPSGVHTMDFFTHGVGNNNGEVAKSMFPGTTTVFDATSGTSYTGYKVQGTWIAITSAHNQPFEKCLVLGYGALRASTIQRRGRDFGVSIPQVAQSGWTIGLWVLPQNDGFRGVNLVAPEANSSQAHCLISQGTVNQGFFIGVSGYLMNDARGSEFVEDTNPATLNRQLRAYAHFSPPNVNRDILLDTPIESGRFTHITVTYRFVSNSINEWVLYKDGRVAASGQENDELTDNDLLFRDAPLVIGGVTFATEHYTTATGFGHMVSGIYAFRRVLHEGEVLQLHNQGSFEYDQTTKPLKEAVEIFLDDDGIIGYYPFINPGFADASKNRFPLYAQEREANLDAFATYAGPFGRGGVHNDYSAAANPIVAGSGTMQLFSDASNAAGFTIAGFFGWHGVNSWVRNVTFGLGAFGTTTAFPPAGLTFNNAGFLVGFEGPANDIAIKAYVFEGGNPSDRISVSGQVTDINARSPVHIAFAYNNADNGVALYINGDLQSSGTLAASLGQQVARLVGSGYPLCFMGAVQDQNTEQFKTNGGEDLFGSEFLIVNRPLNEGEIRFLATSGIDLVKNYYTPNDPRLRGYWKCTSTHGDNPFIVQDRARIWDRLPAPLTRAQSNEMWGRVESSFDQGQFGKVDLFGQDRTLPSELDSFGNLGITSGTFVVMGGSMAGQGHTATLTDRSSPGSILGARFRMATDSSSVDQPNFNEEYILSFEVTPSGNIPDFDIPLAGGEPNSIVYATSPGTSAANTNRFIAYLTSLNSLGPDPVGFDAGLGASGVSIVFFTVDTNVGTDSNPVISGILPFGVPSRVMFHMKPTSPYLSTPVDGSRPVKIDLYINGNKVNSIEHAPVDTRMWAPALSTAASNYWIYEFGGYAIDDILGNPQGTYEDGLGEVYVREIFIAQGQFSNHDLDFFAQSGVARSSTLTGFNDQLPTTIIRVNDARLVGYYRFTGGVGGSGTLDLSNKGNDLTNIADEAWRDNPGGFSNNSYLFNVRYIPGPLTKTSLGIQSSGISLLGLIPANDAAAVPAFAASGTGFDSPENGFSLGFLYRLRNDNATNISRIIASYGLIPNSNANTSNVDASWAVIVDDTENVKLQMSKDGVMYIDPISVASKASSIEVGSNTLLTTYKDEKFIELHRYGAFDPGHQDAWVHYSWTYNSTIGTVKAFINGVLCDQKSFSTDGIPDTLNTPTDPTARILSFLTGQSAVWNWETIGVDSQGVITDFFYANEELTEREIRYIALNGFAEGDTPTASGIIGGYIEGFGEGSGLIGGYIRGLLEVSGIVGGYLQGSILSSGIIGGYVSGVPAPKVSGLIGGYITGFGELSGIIGGYLQGQEAVSGLFGGYITGFGEASGIIGGFINGGLSGVIEFDGFFEVESFTAEDFDALIHISRQTNSDFDAKVEVFQSECPPEVRIAIPEAAVSGLVPPFNQYFIGFASGVQGKTITQTRWSFGDFGGFSAGTESGTNPGFYPAQHRFVDQGFYAVKFEAIDSNGQHNSAIQFVHAASGVDPVRIALSGIPQIGEAELTVQFSQTFVSIPAGISIANSLLDLDKGQTTTITNPLVIYNEPGIYKPVWCVRDSRGIIWCDSIEPGIDLDKIQNQSGM